MTPTDTLQQLLMEIAAEAGFAPMPLDDDGCLGLRLDEAVDVMIRLHPELPRVELYSDVGTLPSDQEARGEMLLQLLQANAFWRETAGATLSLRSDGETVCLGAHQPLSGLTSQTLQDWLIEFANTAAIWMERFETESFEMPESEEPQDVELVNASFIRV